MWRLVSTGCSQSFVLLESSFDNGKSMTRFVTDLLHYLRDLLIVQTGEKNTHHSSVFVENLALPQKKSV